ncbi:MULTISPECIES: DUF2149 domain-containing protein [unclassified Thioalkalivibrio]|uniref:DUF2149 domain-containing protein n=1 Tax=unclassified Thioalkalivibrio TaxID=2621013 RepID=UPI00035FA749|nr:MULTISPECIES: DUF2149 domain-containing protein [unclassified Thioalkalivibrio]
MSRFLDSEEEADPILSVVNIVDVFLVIIVVLLIMVAQSAASEIQDVDSAEQGEVVPETMEELDRYESSGEIGEGQGVRAGTTYQLEDGTMVFVPDENE